MLENAGDPGNGHSRGAAPARSHPRLHQRSGLLLRARRRRREGAHQALGTRSATRARASRRAGPPAPGAEQEGEEHPWVAKRGERVRHLARKMLVATETRHFPSPFWAICVLGRREGLPVTYQLHRTCCLSLLDGSAGVLRRPPTPRSSLLRGFGALQDVVGPESSPRDGICCSGGAPRAETPSLGLGATRTCSQKLLGCSWSTDVGGILP